MIEASAKATVPVLCTADGTVLEQSLDIMRWALREAADPARLFEVQPKQQLELISRNDEDFKHWLDRYKYHVRFPEHSAEHYRQQGLQFLSLLETHLDHSPYLFGGRVQMADIAILPFVRQFCGVDRRWFESNVSEALRQWLNSWQDSDIFNRAMVKYPIWQPGQAPVLL